MANGPGLDQQIRAAKAPGELELLLRRGAGYEMASAVTRRRWKTHAAERYDAIASGKA